MKRHTALFAAIVALAAIAVIGVQSASADPSADNHAYVCYSSVAGPMLVSADDSSVFPTWSSYAAGYFAPMAESSTPTTTQMAGGWYLTCSLAAGWTQVGSYVLGDGKKIDLSGPTDYLVNSLPIPGVYPVIQAAATTTG
ncbi:MAG TPA: hypothetical protein VGU02_12955 [Gaiellaceae bacterium]|nr:hypothetical protein [Gaiellaceae bacterium]